MPPVVINDQVPDSKARRGWTDIFGMTKLVIDNVREFERRVGMLSTDDYFGMPLKPSIGYVFFAWDLDKLLAFVKDHPQYHIISECKPYTFNRFAPDATAWYMGDGDPDPNITNVLTPRYWQKIADTWHASKPRSYAKIR